MTDISTRKPFLYMGYIIADGPAVSHMPYRRSQYTGTVALFIWEMGHIASGIPPVHTS